MLPGLSLSRESLTVVPSLSWRNWVMDVTVSTSGSVMRVTVIDISFQCPLVSVFLKVTAVAGPFHVVVLPGEAEPQSAMKLLLVGALPEAKFILMLEMAVPAETWK